MSHKIGMIQSYSHEQEIQDRLLNKTVMFKDSKDGKGDKSKMRYTI